MVAGDIMPGAFMSNDDCFDLFIDFIESDEWLLPIESFIDYFCLMFPTQDYEEHKPEKMKIFQEYRSIVKLNLDSFLTEILNYNNDLLSNLLALYERHLEFEDMMYILAVEDYHIFHDFMYEAAMAQNRGHRIIGNTRRRNNAQSQGHSNQGTIHMSAGGGANPKNRPITEEDLIQQAIRESMQTQSAGGAGGAGSGADGMPGRTSGGGAPSEEEMIAMAIAASEQEELTRK